MGTGHGFTCKKCGYYYEISLGIGMMFPKVYQSCIRDIKVGKYGEEWKTLARRQKYIAVDAEEYLYVCESCRNWKTDMDLSLYEPKEPDKILNEQFGIKTVKEWGYVPYVMSRELEEDYSLLKAYVHKCDRCGKIMHKFNAEQISSLWCPKCGTENKKSELFRWD